MIFFWVGGAPKHHNSIHFGSVQMLLPSPTSPTSMELSLPLYEGFIHTEPWQDALGRCLPSPFSGELQEDTDYMPCLFPFSSWPPCRMRCKRHHF